MTRFKAFAGERPVLFVFFILITWFLASGLAVGLAPLLLGVSITEPLSQSIGMVAATIYLLWLGRRFDWLRPAGISFIGDWKTWLIAMGILIYFIVVYWLAFFGNLTLNNDLLRSSGEVPAIFWQQIVVGIAEEILFRGIILYALVSVWGRTFRGQVAGVVLSAFLFGALHILQIAAGKSIVEGLVAVLDSFAGGLWWGALAIIFATIWPGVVFHSGSNMAVLIKAVTIPGIVLSTEGYTMAILLQIPLIILAFWWMRRKYAFPIPAGVPIDNNESSSNDKGKRGLM